MFQLSSVILYEWIHWLPSENECKLSRNILRFYRSIFFQFINTLLFPTLRGFFPFNRRIKVKIITGKLHQCAAHSQCFPVNFCFDTSIAKEIIKFIFSIIKYEMSFMKMCKEKCNWSGVCEYTIITQQFQNGSVFSWCKATDLKLMNQIRIQSCIPSLLT